MLDGKKIAILVEEDFEDAKLIEPLRSMKNTSARVSIIGSGSQETYKGKRGAATVRDDVTADKVNAADFDAIIIPGGHAPDKMRSTAICYGPQLLISADIVRGRQVTAWPSIAVDLRNAGAYWVDAPVAQDGNLIKSRKPADLPRFNKAIIEALRD